MTWKLHLYADAAFEIKENDLVICQRNAMPDDLVAEGIRNARLLASAPMLVTSIEEAIECIESTAERLQNMHALLARQLMDKGRQLRGVLGVLKGQS